MGDARKGGPKIAKKKYAAELGKREEVDASKAPLLVFPPNVSLAHYLLYNYYIIIIISGLD